MDMDDTSLDTEQFPVLIAVRVTPEQKLWLKVRAREFDRSMSSVLRRLIDAEMKKATK